MAEKLNALGWQKAWAGNLKGSRAETLALSCSLGSRGTVAKKARYVEWPGHLVPGAGRLGERSDTGKSEGCSAGRERERFLQERSQEECYSHQHSPKDGILLERERAL